MKKRILVLALCLVLMIAVCGCNKKQESSTNTVIGKGYPIETDSKLTYWVAMNSNVSASAANIADTEFAKELTKRTGVEVEYIHPPQGQESEMFSLMIASDELADIIEYDWLRALGGPEKAIKDKIILPLGVYFKNYAPGISS